MKDKIFIIRILLAVLVVCLFVIMKTMSTTTITHPDEVEEEQPNYLLPENEQTEIVEEEDNTPVEEIPVIDTEILDWGILKKDGKNRLWVRVKSSNLVTIDLNLDVDLYLNDEKVFASKDDNNTLYSPVILPNHEAVLYTDYKVPDDQEYRAEFSQIVRRIQGYDDVSMSLSNSRRDGNKIIFDIQTNETAYKSIWGDVLCYKDGKLVEFINKRLRAAESLSNIEVECTSEFDSYDVIVNIFK